MPNQDLPPVEHERIQDDYEELSVSPDFAPNDVHMNIPFPWKLHDLLEKAEEESFADIVSWLPDEHSFRVHHVKPFVERIIKRFFKQTKYKSFQRQLNMWGFSRILNGPNKGGYSHDFFIRGKPFLCRHMIRLKVKGTGGGVPQSGSPEVTNTVNAVAKNKILHDSTIPIMGMNSNLKHSNIPALPSSVFSPFPLGAAGSINDLIGGTTSISTSINTSITIQQEGRMRVDEEQQDEDSAGEGTKTLGCTTSDISTNYYRQDDHHRGHQQEDWFPEWDDDDTFWQGDNLTMPIEGDVVLFEGRQFFFVNDYHSPSPSSSMNGNQETGGILPSMGGEEQDTQQRRRLSIEVNNNTIAIPYFPSLVVGSNRKGFHGVTPQRRLSLLPLSMQHLTKKIDRNDNDPVKTFISSTATGRLGRRFSIEKVSKSPSFSSSSSNLVFSSSTSYGSLTGNHPSEYILRQLL